jgi:hypothetical protein
MPHPNRIVILLFVLLLLATAGFGQQSYVSRFDVYTGYAFLDSPHLSLFANGFQTQFGVRPKTWVSFGLDYSVTKGDMTLTSGLLPTALQQQLTPVVTALLQRAVLSGAMTPAAAASYQLVVPASATTQTFAGGPQFSYRHFSKVTLFVRPSFGAIHETATPNPGDPIATAIAAGLAPSGKKSDWQGFYGFGYGFDLLFSKHVGLRVQGDLVWDHLFNDLLANGSLTTRFSVGPCFNFGKNIKE